ncbi:hypothetical protein [Clostridium vincentii]|uniref:Uncharacterized protein n=1 Tax=Clostridium vincentii TaxID=52704 RepID=A0A2T0B7Z7_9CLOT|nr:hypothetical protein [Clostridium vincentii]PRR79975.1 hypothetical protein CLVI_31620 [Clostridium vincentii]
MSDYKMDIRGYVGLSEFSNIYDYLGVVDKNDSFTMTVDTTNDTEINMINSMLKDNSFYISEEGYDVSGIYHISAYKIQ